MARSCARGLAILVCVDGLASYVTAFRRAFRDPVRTGCQGRPRLEAVPGLLIGQVVKQQARRRVTGVTAAAIVSVLVATGTGTGIDTASLERLDGRTPAMAAGLTDRRWTMQELLSHRVPPPLRVAPKRWGRPPKRQKHLSGELPVTWCPDRS